MMIIPKMLDTIRIGVTIEEVYNDELQITEHPVEQGAAITDHAYKRQPDVVLKCGWSNADYAALLSSPVVDFDEFGSTTQSEYIDAVYSQLLKLQESRVRFDAVTSRRKYSNVLLQGLRVVHDAKTSGALMLTATLRQIRIVQTKATRLPPRDDQADPSRTAETQNTGSKQAVPATPAPGGSVTPQ
ncbi:phage baseplate protein [Pandoraea sp. E26]